MKLGIVGAGNVGSSLVFALARLGYEHAVEVTARNPDHAEAAILDAASAFPETAVNFISKPQLAGNYDFVVVTAGLQPSWELRGGALLDANLEIMLQSIDGAQTEKLIVIGTPVDELTQVMTNHSDVQAKTVIGFGGELDVARIKYALLKQKLTTDNAFVVGEHGPRMIPALEDETYYDDIKQEASSVLKRIKQWTPNARNIATGHQLARLVMAFSDDQTVQCISRVDPDFSGLSITWPYNISKNGIGEKVSLKLGPKAQKDLESLLKVRRGK